MGYRRILLDDAIVSDYNGTCLGQDRRLGMDDAIVTDGNVAWVEMGRGVNFMVMEYGAYGVSSDVSERISS